MPDILFAKVSLIDIELLSNFMQFSTMLIFYSLDEKVGIAFIVTFVARFNISKSSNFHGSRHCIKIHRETLKGVLSNLIEGSVFRKVEEE